MPGENAGQRDRSNKLARIRPERRVNVGGVQHLDVKLGLAAVIPPIHVDGGLAPADNRLDGAQRKARAAALVGTDQAERRPGAGHRLEVDAPRDRLHLRVAVTDPVRRVGKVHVIGVLEVLRVILRQVRRKQA